MVKKTKNKKTVVVVSGGFDPIHIGHLELFKEAKALGGELSELVVILNNDNWLKKKKGCVFMPQNERKAIIESLKWVDRVTPSMHGPAPSDMSVVKELAKIKPDIFANGGDRDRNDARKKSSSLNPEHDLCRKLGIEMKFNVGRSGKIQSSSWLLNNFLKNKNS